MRLPERLFQIALHAYPRAFRQEYGEEMQAVFTEALEEASHASVAMAGWVFLRELSGLLAGAWGQRRILARSAAPQAGAWEGPPNSMESLLALAVFCLPALSLLLNLPWQVSTGILALFLSGVLAAGLSSGLPRWSLPAFGFLLSAFSFLYIFQWAADLVTPTMLARLGLRAASQSAWLVLHSFWAGLMWLCLFALIALVFGLMALIRRGRELLARIWQDWTLASYILYSGGLFTLVLTFDQYRYARPYTLASLLCLATGSWLFLHSARPWQRTLSLLTGLTLAMCLALTSLVPAGSSFPETLMLAWQAPASERWLEARRVLLNWGWMVMYLLAPALVRLLPRVRRATPAGT